MVQNDSSWSQIERGFHQKRGELLKEVDLREYVDHPFLFMKRQRVTDYLTRIKIFEKIIGVKGSVIECGVHKGGSLLLYYHLSSILEPYEFTRKVYGFDTFEGFRSISEKDSCRADEGLFSDADYEVLKKAIEIQDMNRAVSHLPKCELIRGDATKTIPEFKKNHPELIIALLYLDFDLYEPTKAALENFLPLIPKGGIVVFDQLNHEKWPGETEALKSILNLNEIELQRFYFDPFPSFFVVGNHA